MSSNKSPSILFSPHGELHVGASLLSPDDQPILPPMSASACMTAISTATTTPGNINQNNNNENVNHLPTAAAAAAATATQNPHKTPMLSLSSTTATNANDLEPLTVQSQLRSSNKKRPREDSISLSSSSAYPFHEKPSYRVVAGKRYPLHPFAIRLIEQVVNQGSKNVLSDGFAGQKEKESENERKMRLHLANRFTAVRDEHASLVDFARKLLHLWGGRLELKNSTTDHTSNYSSCLKKQSSTTTTSNRRISFKPSPLQSSSALNSRVSPLIRRSTSPNHLHPPMPVSSMYAAPPVSSMYAAPPSLRFGTSPALHRFDDLEEDDLMSGLDFLDDTTSFSETLSSAAKPTPVLSSSWPKRKQVDASRRVTYQGTEATLPQLGGGGKENQNHVRIMGGGGGKHNSKNSVNMQQQQQSGKKQQQLAPITPATGLKRGVRWDAQERKLFLQGLEKWGAGNWKEIHKLIPGRTYVQVKSMGVYLVSKFNMSRGQGPSKVVTDYLVGVKGESKK